MKITIHSGSDQIGGCITEYEINGWKLFVDYGEQLTDKEQKELKIEGLNKGDLSKSALFITHYHFDHVGKIDELPKELPIYMGELTKDILSELSNHLSSVSEKEARIAKRLESVVTFKAGELIHFGDFKITPVTIDHSAFDAYSFKIEAESISAFHTGDFRTHGFRSGKLFQMLDRYVGKVDYVVCEATNVARQEVTIKSERDLQKEYEEAFSKNKANIVYVSTTNIDRLFSLYHAAIKTGLPFYVDPFQKRIMDTVTNGKSIWRKSKFYQYGFKQPTELMYESHTDNYLYKPKFEDDLANRGYVLIARPTDRFDNLIEKLPGEKKKYLSMWNGYLKPESPAFKPRLAESVGSDAVYMHTSGHIDMGSLFKFFETLNPKAIIPIHTNNPKSFADLFSNRWPILLLKDGEYFNPIKDPGYDNNTASILAVKKLENDINLISIEDSEKCYSLDKKYLGEFRDHEEALLVFKSIHYANLRLLGYCYEEEEDMEPWVTKTYTPNLTVNSEYEHGGHSPEGAKFQTPISFRPGDKVLCVFYQGLDIVFPAIYEGPITLEFLKEVFEKKEDLKIHYGSFHKYKDDLLDFDWDSVVVRPLVKIDNEDWEDKMLIRRPLVFPYKKFDI